jgi:hypothetical protein
MNINDWYYFGVSGTRSDPTVRFASEKLEEPIPLQRKLVALQPSHSQSAISQFRLAS